MQHCRPQRRGLRDASVTGIGGKINVANDPRNANTRYNQYGELIVFDKVPAGHEFLLDTYGGDFGVPDPKSRRFWASEVLPRGTALWTRSAGSTPCEKFVYTQTDHHPDRHPSPQPESGSADAAQSYASPTRRSAALEACYGSAIRLLRRLGIDREIIRIKADGNCQFRALAVHRYNDSSRHMDVRHAVCDFASRSLALQTILKGFTAGLSNDDRCRTRAQKTNDEQRPESVPAYISRMQQEGEWGDEATLAIYASMTGRAVTVVSVGRQCEAYTAVPGTKPDADHTPPVALYTEEDLILVRHNRHYIATKSVDL